MARAPASVSSKCCSATCASPPGARFSTAFAAEGWRPSTTLPGCCLRMIGVEHALDLLLSARVFEADEAPARAHRAGCASPRGVPAAQAYARDIAVNCAPAALAMIRRQVYDEWTSGSTRDCGAKLSTMTYLNGQPDLGEGVASFKEKRQPHFAPTLPSDFDAASVLKPSRAFPEAASVTLSNRNKTAPQRRTRRLSRNVCTDRPRPPSGHHGRGRGGDIPPVRRALRRSSRTFYSVRAASTGDVIAVFMENNARYHEVCWGARRSGCISSR